MTMKHSFLAAPVLLFGIVAAMSARAEVPAPVSDAVRNEIAAFQLRQDAAVITPVVENSEQGNVTGYQAWVALPTGGNLVVDVDLTGHEAQRYTRDGGKLPGVRQF